MKDVRPQIYETQQTQGRIYARKTRPKYIIVKMLERYAKEPMLKADIETCHINKNSTNDSDFLLEIWEDLKQLNNIFKVLKEKTDQSGSLYPMKLFIRNEVEIKAFSNREFVSGRTTRNTIRHYSG